MDREDWNGKRCSECQERLIVCRYKCMRCIEYNRCITCQFFRQPLVEHIESHPFQPMLKLFGGEAVRHKPHHTCPYCGNMGYDAKQIFAHVQKNHRDDKTKVMCPICLAMQFRGESPLMTDLAAHMRIKHADKGPGLPPISRAVLNVMVGNFIAHRNNTEPDPKPALQMAMAKVVAEDHNYCEPADHRPANPVRLSRSARLAEQINNSLYDIISPSNSDYE